MEKHMKTLTKVLFAWTIGIGCLGLGGISERTVHASGDPAICARAMQVCHDAQQAANRCLGANPITGIATCSPLVDAAQSVCAQADFTCSHNH
jgi:hypothetical protein